RGGVPAHGPEAARPAVLGEPVPVPEPGKNRSGNRVYQRREIELIMLVKHLLYTEKYTIEGARQKIEQYRRSGELKPEARRALATETVRDLKTEIKAILTILEGASASN